MSSRHQNDINDEFEQREAHSERSYVGQKRILLQPTSVEQELRFEKTSAKRLLTIGKKTSVTRRLLTND